MRITRVVWPRTLVAAAVQSALAAMALFPHSADGAPITWMGGNNDWIEGGSTALWSPADEPDADDTAIFNTANAVNLGSNNSILALTMSAGIDLNTSNFNLDVNGLVQLTDASTNLIVGGAGSLLTADSFTINSGANAELNGGTIQINEESGNGLLDINVGGELVGHGTLSMTDAVGANTTLIVNDGAITARRASLVIFGAPQVGTLTINATDVDTRMDLDGVGVAEDGVVNVTRNQTLDLNVALTDAFGGTVNLFQNTTLDMAFAWNSNTGTINVDNGFVDGTFPNPDVPAGVSIIAGATFTQSGGAINVLDTDGTLQFDAPFSMTGGTFNNAGHVIFNANATIGAAATFTMGVSGSDLTVGPNADVLIDQASFNLDGTAAGTVITVNQGGVLTLDLGDYDNDSATNAFDGTVTLDRGQINVSSADAEFVMDAVLNMNGAPGSPAVWLGEPVDIGNDVGSLDADVNVTGTGSATAQFAAAVDFNSDADVNVAAGATLVFQSAATVNFSTVNAASNAEFTGAGEISFNGGVNVIEAVTLNMVGGTVDLDGTDAVGEFINVDAPLTINAATLRDFARTNMGGGTNTLDINSSVGTGVLTVNLDNANSEWTLNAQGVMNLVNDNTDATLLAGSGANLNGTVNVTGDVRVTARVDLGSTAVVNILTAGQPLRLAGGNNAGNPNTIAGGTISGAGLLGADTGKALHGYGTINTGIDFDGAADLKADNGTLTINGAIVDAGQVGTADADGTLHVANAWNNNVTTGVQLNGGTLSGGTITNDVAAGISGHGLVTARVVNNTQLFASLGDTLVFQTGLNDNDWDGTTNTGEIEAVSANIEIRDVGAAFGFTGTVRATNNHTAFANGFALDFNPGSTLILESGGTYRSTSSTDIGGTVSVGVSESNIQVENNFFLTFEPTSVTTLNGNLRLLNNNINIEAGATFSGAGAIVVPDGSHMVADNLADVGVLLDMQGAFRPGNFNGIGRIALLDYQQANTGELFVEMRGTALNAFDRLVASGDVVLDGYLNIDIDEVSPGVPFVPVLGQTFNIVTGNTVTGEFDFTDNSGMPDGLTFYLHYLPNALQLQVVTTPFFSADFDEDGDVDNTDLAIWRGAYDLNQLGDADGDNDTDGADLLLWQRQFGSHPGPGGSALSPIPEPTSLVALLAACFTCATAFGRRRRNPSREPGVKSGNTSSNCIRLAIVSSILAFVVPHTAVAQTVSLSLNVQYTNPDNIALGGAWTLVAKTNSANGIASIHAILSDINTGGITAQTGIGAVLNGGNPFVSTKLGSVEIVYFQDLGVPASVVTNVGRGAGTPGNVAFDPLNDPAWNNSARIFSGTFNTTTPAFTSNDEVTDANVLSTGVPPYTFATPASVTTIVRHNGTDFWDNTSGSGLWSDAVNWSDNSEPGTSHGVTFPAGFPNGDTTVTLAGGEIARQLTFHDSYTLTGGALTLTGASTVIHVDPGRSATIASSLTPSGNLQVAGGGTLTLSSANTYTGGTTVQAGTLRVTRLHENNPVNIIAGKLQVMDSSPTLPSHPAGNNAFFSRPSALTIANNGAPIGTRVYLGQLDLTNNDLILDYAGATPFAAIADMIRAGYNGGNWLGNGITSSTANANSNFALAIADNSQLTIPFGPARLFSGQVVDATTILVKFTHRIDLDLDGVVTTNDATIFNSNYNEGSPAYWSIGDLDYDRVFTTNDATLFNSFYNEALASVPDPGALGVLGLMGVSLLFTTDGREQLVPPVTTMWRLE